MKRIRSASWISESSLILLASLVLFGPRSSADAAVFERDWKVPGDGLLTYDDVNQREWLDFSVSELTQFPGTGHAERLPHAIGEIAPGGLFAGFTLAKREDVIALAESAGINTETDDSVNSAAVNTVINLLGITNQSTRGNHLSSGFIDEREVNPLSSGQVGAHFFLSPDSGPNGRAGLVFNADIGGNDFFRRSGRAGLLLYRPIPEPSTSFLFLAGIFAAWTASRQRHDWIRRALCMSPVVAFCFSGIAPAGAAVFERDWKVPGDGLLTYDDVNQRDWLDLSVSDLFQFPGLTAQQRLQHAIGEIGPGGLFESFTFAKRQDVIALAHSAGIDTSTNSYAINASGVSEVIALLGVNFQSSASGSLYSSGFIDEIASESFPFNFVAQFRLAPTIGPSGQARLSFSDGNDSHRFPLGVMLYRPIPEPSTSFLFLAGIFAAWTASRQRHDWIRRALCMSPVVAFCFSGIAPADAAVFERDWKVSGDGLLTYDDVNQREWLDLSVSDLFQFPGLDAQQRLQHAIGEIGPGGLFESFTFAKREDVIALARSAGIDTSTDSYAINAPGVSEVIALLGFNFQSTGGILFSNGFIDEIESESFPYNFAAQFRLAPSSDPGGPTHLNFSAGNDRHRFPLGVMLYRPIPEPSSLALALGGFSLMLLVSSRRVCRQH